MLGTVVAALVLFSWDRMPADVTALGMLLFLVLAGLLPAEQAFAGFGSEVVVMMLWRHACYCVEPLRVTCKSSS